MRRRANPTPQPSTSPLSKTKKINIKCMIIEKSVFVYDHVTLMVRLQPTQKRLNVININKMHL
jgi:hypothetical protein